MQRADTKQDIGVFLLYGENSVTNTAEHYL
jgi:hypothetical protein